MVDADGTKVYRRAVRKRGGEEEGEDAAGEDCGREVGGTDRITTG